MKYLNFKRYKFSTIQKSIDNIKYAIFKIFRHINFKRYNLSKLYKYKDKARFYFVKIAKLFNLKTYDISRFRKIKFQGGKVLYIHIPAAIIFFTFLYLLIPTFYNYDKKDIEKIICESQNIKCDIKGKVTYRFYPSPRIIIKNLAVNDHTENKNALIVAENTIIKLSIKNLLAKDKHKFKKIELRNYTLNFDLNTRGKYKNIFQKKIDLIPISFSKGQIIFVDKKNYVATIHDANIQLIFGEKNLLANLKGNFLNDDIYFNLEHEKSDDKYSTNFIAKMQNLNFTAKGNLFNLDDSKKAIGGNILVKKNKHKFTSAISYENNEITFKKSNITNPFLEGELSGKIKFLPYFNFEFDMGLNSLNFTKLYNSFLNLGEEGKKGIFNINSKINGKLNISADKIYSRFNLAKSFESRIKFNNGSIFIDQLIVNLGKLGAADILGSVQRDEKLTNFKFESNIFVDNQKKFLSKFGIYNKKKISPSLYISGNFDLEKSRATFYEISNDVKLKDEDINYMEKEFNSIMLEDGYNTLFYFPKFKTFIKTITDEAN
tara:strand:- start:851 stop:2488 length:1638 start_codon:yes stop_codon:yes gene_type:complete